MNASAPAWPSPESFLRPRASFERGAAFVTEGSRQICPGVKKTNVTFSRQDRTASGWVVEIQPGLVECDIWVDPAMVGYDMHLYASTKRLAAQTGKTHRPLPGKTIPQFRRELPAERRDRTILVGPATQGGFWGANTILQRYGELIRKTVPGLYQDKFIQPEGDFYFLVLDPGNVRVQKIEIKSQDRIEDMGLGFVGPPLWYRGRDLSDRIRFPKNPDGSLAPLISGYDVNWDPQTTITSFVIWGCNRKTGIVYYFPMVRGESQGVNGVTIKEMVEGFMTYAAQNNIDMQDVDLILGPGGVDTNVILPDEALASTIDPRSQTAADYPDGRPLGTIFHVSAKTNLDIAGPEKQLAEILRAI